MKNRFRYPVCELASSVAVAQSRRVSGARERRQGTRWTWGCRGRRPKEGSLWIDCAQGSAWVFWSTLPSAFFGRFPLAVGWCDACNQPANIYKVIAGAKRRARLLSSETPVDSGQRKGTWKHIRARTGHWLKIHLRTNRNLYLKGRKIRRVILSQKNRTRARNYNIGK